MDAKCIRYTRNMLINQLKEKDDLIKNTKEKLFNLYRFYCTTDSIDIMFTNYLEKIILELEKSISIQRK